jgi:hypothetical protein
LVNANALRGIEIHVVIGEEVARRQLSQWQCNVQFGSPVYWKTIEPHKHLPDMEVACIAAPCSCRGLFDCADRPLCVNDVACRPKACAPVSACDPKRALTAAF